MGPLGVIFDPKKSLRTHSDSCMAFIYLFIYFPLKTPPENNATHRDLTHAIRLFFPHSATSSIYILPSRPLDGMCKARDQLFIVKKIKMIHEMFQLGLRLRMILYTIVGVNVVYVNISILESLVGYLGWGH